MKNVYLRNENVEDNLTNGRTNSIDAGITSIFVSNQINAEFIYIHRLQAFGGYIIISNSDFKDILK